MMKSMKVLIRGLGTLVMLMVAAPLLLGCEAAILAGGMMQNYEYQKLIEVHAKYSDLEDRSVAVLVDADLATLYEYPELVASISGGVAGRIARDVPGARVTHPDAILGWQYTTPQWNAMPYGEIAEALNVDRVVMIDIFEFRLNPPGNRWEWQGVCAAHVGIIERGSFDPDSYADTYTVIAEYPSIRMLTRDEADERSMQRGLLSEFIKETAWLFHLHERPKYPDKYRAGR